MPDFKHLAGYRARFAQEYSGLRQPTGQVRRHGIEAFALDMLPTIDRELAAIDELDRSAPEGIEEAMGLLTDLTLELASYLYAAGADHRLWRRWVALTAFGLYLTERWLEAAIYAAIAGEWLFHAALPPLNLNQNHVSDRVIWKLIGGRPAPRLPEQGEDPFSEAWLKLAHAIPLKDHASTGAALQLIADDWIEMGDGDWRTFHPRSYPNFEATVCAAAALARHYGYQSQGLTEDQRAFLEPGLAAPEPPSLYPGQFKLPAHA